MSESFGEPVSRQETSAEHIPSREEGLSEIGKHCENPTIKRELRDEQGLYLLEAEVPGAASGETTEYIYQRKGKFPNGSDAKETIINVVYLEDGIPVGGHSVAEYDSATKNWK
jgi:hypothetical protein